MQQPKKVIVVGANGNISRQLIPLLIKKYQVYSMVRSPPQFAINSINLKFIQGDALSAQLWDQWLEGTHAVISCFGPRQQEPEANYLQFIKLLIEKMKQKNVRRLISFFTHGAMKNHDGKYLYEQQNYDSKDKAKVHAQCISALNDSQINYTAVCLWKFQKGQKSVEGSQKCTKSAADSQGLADFVISEIESPKHERKTVFVSNKQS